MNLNLWAVSGIALEELRGAQSSGSTVHANTCYVATVATCGPVKRQNEVLLRIFLEILQRHILTAEEMCNEVQLKTSTMEKLRRTDPLLKCAGDCDWFWIPEPLRQSDPSTWSRRRPVPPCCPQSRCRCKSKSEIQEVTIAPIPQKEAADCENFLFNTSHDESDDASSGCIL